jgi:hypothetical protein
MYYLASTWREWGKLWNISFMIPSTLIKT